MKKQSRAAKTKTRPAKPLTKEQRYAQMLPALQRLDGKRHSYGVMYAAIQMCAAILNGINPHKVLEGTKGTRHERTALAWLKRQKFYTGDK